MNAAIAAGLIATDPPLDPAYLPQATARPKRARKAKAKAKAKPKPQKPKGRA